MTNYRIIRRKGYTYLCSLEKQAYWGSWYELMYGDIEECKTALKNLKETGSIKPVIILHTESF